MGVWLSYQLAYGISHAESVMDLMAMSAFPSRTIDINEASRQIKIEITRSRRYHCPLGLIVIEARSDEKFTNTELVFAIKNDLSNRFSFSRIGQVLDDNIRQTDMLFRERYNRFVVLCPETNLQNAQILAERISDVIQNKISVKVSWAVAAFPDDALSFDDLLEAAKSKLTKLMKEGENLGRSVKQKVNETDHG